MDKNAYYKTIRKELNFALCIREFPSQAVERHNYPEVEYGENKELLLKPIEVEKSEIERVLIEPSINSVRVSVRVINKDLIEELFIEKFCRYLMTRSHEFVVIRKKAVPTFHCSFLITNKHMQSKNKQQMIEFVPQFITLMDSYCREIKGIISLRANQVGQHYARLFKNN